MNLYKISQDVNNGYDTFSDAIVAAETEDQAQKTHPRGFDASDCDWEFEWAPVEVVKVKLIGTAIEGTEAGVVCASFHAG